MSKCMKGPCRTPSACTAHGCLASITKTVSAVLVKTEDGQRYQFPAEPDDTGHTEVPSSAALDLRMREIARQCEEDASPLNYQVGGDHYKSKGIQPVEYAHANKLGFFEGSVVKYVTRWRDKGGIADLEKAAHFIELLIELEKKNG